MKNQSVHKGVKYYQLSNLKLSLLITLLVTAVISTTAYADCPNGDPCETSHYFRIQSWPVPLQDVDGRSMLSLQEANATNEAAFSEVITSMAASNALAIRFQVTRITSAPQNYCECNFEYNGAGCHAGLPSAQLLMCARNCRYANAACRGTGSIPKQTGGDWYSFPAATQVIDRNNGPWGRNPFDPNAHNHDWFEEPGIIKRASCLADALANEPAGLTINQLFENDAPCPIVTQAELNSEAIPRP